MKSKENRCDGKRKSAITKRAREKKIVCCIANNGFRLVLLTYLQHEASLFGYFACCHQVTIIKTLYKKNVKKNKYKRENNNKVPRAQLKRVACTRKIENANGFMRQKERAREKDVRMKCNEQ